MPLMKIADEVAGLRNWIDTEMKNRQLFIANHSQDVTATAMSWLFPPKGEGFRAKEFSLSFSNTVARNFTISRVSGANIVTHRNDRFWVWVDDVGTRPFTLAQGYYSTAAAFCVAIKSALESQPDVIAAGLTFTVTLSATTRKITITNSGGKTMRWVAFYTKAPVRGTSSAGANMGFTVDQGPAASLVSDTGIDVGVNYVLLAEVADASQTWVCTDGFSFDSDSGLRVSTNTAAVVVNFKMVYELL